MTVKTNSGYNNYYFRKNIFGDIVEVYDSGCYPLVTYTYDAFGNATVKVHPINDRYAQLNPFRYRGYYWDEEIELYYVQKRYYDPEIGRFISPDSIEYINPSEIFGLNLYAYCYNNPIELKHILAYGKIAAVVSSINIGGNTLKTDEYVQGTVSIPNLEITQLIIGSAPDLILVTRYLVAKGMHSKSVYPTNSRIIYPIMGGTHRWIKKSTSVANNFINASSGVFGQILTGNAKAGIGAIAKSVGKTLLINAVLSLVFNLIENDGKLDASVIKETAIDTAVGTGAYLLAAGTMSLVAAGLVAAGIAVPGFVVIGGIILLSIGFDWIIREIFNCH